MPSKHNKKPQKHKTAADLSRELDNKQEIAPEALSNR
jgi:hypothetical protein